VHDRFDQLVDCRFQACDLSEVDRPDVIHSSESPA
jgi:hypothetical protein